MVAKVDAMSHQWVASLANYNFQLYYRAGKTNIDADALLRVSWSACVPNTSGTHHWVTAVAVQALQEATREGSNSPIDAYSCSLHVLDLLGDSLQVACMILAIGITPSRQTLSWALWFQGYRMGPWARPHWNRLTHPSSGSSFKNATTSSWGVASCIGKSYHRTPYFNWSCWPHTGRPLQEGAMMRSATQV